MTAPRDPELIRLLIEELGRHEEALTQGQQDEAAARRAVHALKGSAGLAGERELASALSRIERRVREGDATALRDATSLVRTARHRLRDGQTATAAAWPEPPPDLEVRPIDPSLRGPYFAELLDRLARIDDALGSSMSAIEASAHLYRQVHTIKGAASAVADEPMSWFCHGLEDRLREGSTSEAGAIAALTEAARWRAVLGGLLDDPEAALRRLRSTSRRTSGITPAQHGTHPPSNAPDEGPRSVVGEDTTFRVSAAAVDRLLDRVSTISGAREGIGARLERTHSRAAELRTLRAELATALRLIGPPRPWGAPAAAISRIQQTAAALTRLSDHIEADSVGMRRRDQLLRDAALAAKRELATMRQTPVAALLARIASAAMAEARRAGREVSVVTRGGDVSVDRRIVEQLADPCLHLARNAVAHGIEAPRTRVAARKPPVGTINIDAEKTTTRLRITIEDDGAGVDVADIRRRAVDAGAVTPSLAEAADDNTLLALLFLPGFSTRESSDLLAGRGIGLDIALAAVQRLSGGIRLSSRLGEGFKASIEVPVDTGVTNVLWVEAAGEEYALVAGQIARVQPNVDRVAETTPHLAACLGREVAPTPMLALDLAVEDSADDWPTRVGVDRIGHREDLLIRPLTPLVAAMGPFAGAIVRGDGTLRLALDAYALAPRARALGRMPGAATSDRPRGR